jgi:hypothetical protein
LLNGLARLGYSDREVYEKGVASLARRKSEISDPALAQIAAAARSLAKSSLRVDPLLELLAELVEQKPGVLLPHVRGVGRMGASKGCANQPTIIQQPCSPPVG